jgi:hypothetical protein
MLNLAAFIQPTSKKNGAIMAWQSPKLYEYFIKGINALSKEIDFIGWEECLDFVYYYEIGLCICCIKTGQLEAQIYTLDTKEYVTMSTGIKVFACEESIHLVRKQGLNLFVKTDKDCISVYFRVNDKLRGKIMRVKNIPGNNIADFRPVGMNRLATLSLDGVINMLEFSKIDSIYGQISVPFKLSLNKSERCHSLAVCPLGKYALVSIVRESSGKDLNSKLVFLEFDDQEGFSVLECVKFHNTDYDYEDGSYFSGLSLDFYHGKYPLVLAQQYNSTGLLFSYIFNGENLIEYHEHYQLHNSPCLQLVKFEDTLNSVDENGNVSRIKFVEPEKSQEYLIAQKKKMMMIRAKEEMERKKLEEAAKAMKKSKLDKSHKSKPKSEKAETEQVRETSRARTGELPKLKRRTTLDSNLSGKSGAVRNGLKKKISIKKSTERISMGGDSRMSIKELRESLRNLKKKESLKKSGVIDGEELEEDRGAKEEKKEGEKEEVRESVGEKINEGVVDDDEF